MGYLCSDNAFLTERLCVDLVDCGVVLFRGGLPRNMRFDLQSLTEPGTAVGHAGSHWWSGVGQCTCLEANLAFCQMTPPQMC